MIIVKSSLSVVSNDLQKYLSEEHELVFGHLICDQIAIWDPVWFDRSKQELPELRFNMDYIERTGTMCFPLPMRGGTIVNNVGDVGVLIVSNDLYSNWTKPAMASVQKYLLDFYNIETEIKGNDMLIDGKKFVGTASGFANGRHVSAMFISMNSDTGWLINKICIKPNEHKGFIGLSEFGVCPRQLINRLLTFTKKWERRAL